MTKHLPLLLFIGLAFWGCEDESEPSLMGAWEYVDHEVIIKQLSDSLYLNEIDSITALNEIDSITADEHQYRSDINLIFRFTIDSLSWGDEKFPYYISKDTIKSTLIQFRFELIDDRLIIKTGGRLGTNSTGTLMYDYDDWWMFDRM